jgi:hypothetical protein
VASGFGVDRAFTNRVKVHSYEMLWATGSDGPVEGAAENKGETRLVIYRSDSGSVCYDAIYSNELVRYVNGLQKPLVHVEYEVFYDFGKARGYNVRSIEGKLITKCAHPVLRDAGSQGGYIGYPNSSGECNR